MNYDLESIETAFFNYDNSGGELSEKRWMNKKQDWKKFKSYLQMEQSSKEKCNIFEKEREEK
jgi:hypothetical protein